MMFVLSKYDPLLIGDLDLQKSVRKMGKEKLQVKQILRSFCFDLIFSINKIKFLSGVVRKGKENNSLVSLIYCWDNLTNGAYTTDKELY